MRVLRFTFAVMLACAVTSVAHAADPLPALDAAAAAKVSFRSDVWPILKRHCWGCHSGDKPKGGLRVDSVADLLKGGDTEPALIKGKPDESLLIKSVVGDKPDMPKKEEPLSAAKIQTLRLWILGGAADDSVGSPQPDAVRIPETYPFAPAVTSVAMSGDGKWVAAACRSEVVLIDAEQGNPVRRIATECDLVTHVVFSPDGAIIAIVGGSPSQFGEVRFIDRNDGRLIASRRVTHDTLFGGSFAPDGKAVAVGGADGCVHVVPLDVNAPVRSFDLHSDWVMSVAYSPDGSMIVSGGRDKATKVCSVETGQLLRSVDIGNDLISGVASDEGFAVSVSRDRQLNAYEYKIALQGVQIGGAGGNGLQPDTKKSQYLKAIEGQPGEVLTLAASGDHKLIATAGVFGEVRVYQVADRKRVATIGNVPMPVYALAMDQEGKRLAIGTAGGSVVVYELPTGKLLQTVAPVPVAVTEAGAR